MDIKNIIFDIIIFINLSDLPNFIFYFFITSLFILPLSVILDKILFIISVKYNRIALVLNINKLYNILDSKEKNKNISNGLIEHIKKRDYKKNIILNNAINVIVKKPFIGIIFLFIINIFFFLYVFHELIIGNIPIYYIVTLIFFNIIINCTIKKY